MDELTKMQHSNPEDFESKTSSSFDKNASTAPLSNNSLPVEPLVFVVDDEPTIGEVIATMLELEGYKTVLFLNANDAYQALTKTNPPPVLLVTDFLMEGINGMELVEKSLKLYPGLKTMIISGSAGPEMFKNRHIKPDCFIRKPFTMENLVNSAQALAPLPKK